MLNFSIFIPIICFLCLLLNDKSRILSDMTPSIRSQTVKPMKLQQFLNILCDTKIVQNHPRQKILEQLRKGGSKPYDII